MSDSKITIAIAHSYVDEKVRINCQNIRDQMGKTVFGWDLRQTRTMINPFPVVL